MAAIKSTSKSVVLIKILVQRIQAIEQARKDVAATHARHERSLQCVQTAIHDRSKTLDGENLFSIWIEYTRDRQELLEAQNRLSDLLAQKESVESDLEKIRQEQFGFRDAAFIVVGFVLGGLLLKPLNSLLSGLF